MSKPLSLREAALEAEILADLDWKQPEVCEHPAGCSEQAVVLGVHTCCGWSFLLCAPHHKREAERAREKPRVCTRCHAPIVPGVTDRFYPLGGQA